jgi:DnaA family protein
MRQLILDLLPEERPSFENFVAGSNGEALTGLAAWLAPANREPLFFLWGEAGAGKSHLLQASEAAYTMRAWTPICRECRPAERSAYAVDNVEALSATGQISLFNLINRLSASGGRLLAAASVPPLQLALREDLRTRLGSSLVYRLQPLSDAEKLAALGEQARARGLTLPPEASAYLFLRAPRDMRSLSGLADGHRPLLARTQAPNHPELAARSPADATAALSCPKGLPMDLVLFDLDNTLIAGDSDFEWAQFLIAKGVLDRALYEAKNLENSTSSTRPARSISTSFSISSCSRWRATHAPCSTPGSASS